ncbi:hypothetical protein [Okeania sp. KiyG1]|uniref:hypothetical protein n=1 Tax=Okeania sp. KiyG1 TaxID=2720165 RepID=UPI0019230FA2|nr:hypothetical protein [Okeania sp. KiyG1]
MQTLQCTTPQGTTKSYQTYQNNNTSQSNDNWLYAGTPEAWLYVDYSQPPYDICTEAETTAYKFPDYEEDWDCYDYSTPAKTPEQIWQEVEDFIASGSSDDFDEF